MPLRASARRPSLSFGFGGGGVGAIGRASVASVASGSADRAVDACLCKYRRPSAPEIERRERSRRAPGRACADGLRALRQAPGIAHLRARTLRRAGAGSAAAISISRVTPSRPIKRRSHLDWIGDHANRRGTSVCNSRDRASASNSLASSSIRHRGCGPGRYAEYVTPQARLPARCARASHRRLPVVARGSGPHRVVHRAGPYPTFRHQPLTGGKGCRQRGQYSGARPSTAQPLNPMDCLGCGTPRSRPRLGPSCSADQREGHHRPRSICAPCAGPSIVAHQSPASPAAFCRSMPATHHRL